MNNKSSTPDKNLLDAQHPHWENAFSNRPDMFGLEVSIPAQQAAARFKKEGKTKILELGAGQGRDTFYFARNGFHVHVLDYSKSGIEAITQKARKLGLSDLITTQWHDVRKPFPIEDESFDACYSHMLYCMALTAQELEFLSQEIRRVLKPDGLNMYTVRQTEDAHYGKGIHRGEAMYEMGGFIVHFFNREKVEHLAKGYQIVEIDEFEEGGLPRKLFKVTLRKV